MSNPQVRVGFFWKGQKGCYYLRWNDPLQPGKRPARKTDLTRRSKRNEREAAKLAEKLEQELNSKDPNDPYWEDFCDQYWQDHLVDTSRANRDKWNAVRTYFEEVACKGRDCRLSEITPLMLVKVETAMRKKLAAGSVPSYMATLRSGLSWAASVELMRELPKPRSRGRETVELPATRLIPISEESLNRMCKVAAKVCGKRHAPSVRRYLRSLWLSGCRMSEPIQIHPSRLDCHHPLQLEGSSPLFSWVNTQKSRKDCVARITMDFAAYMQRFMDREFPFRPTSEHGEITSRTLLTYLVSDIGKTAGVEVEASGKTATAKHFRSSFVTRWSLRGMPLELIQSMVRHASRSTTERYYLGDVNAAREFDESNWVGDQTGDQLRVVG